MPTTIRFTEWPTENTKMFFLLPGHGLQDIDGIDVPPIEFHYSNTENHFMNTNTTPELPFVDLTYLDGRNAVREISLARAERLHVVDFDNIRLRPGKRNKYFNWRIQPEGLCEEEYEAKIGIPELAEAIYKSCGPDDAPIGDFKDGVFYINGGERRYRALRRLLATERTTYPNGAEVRRVEVLQNPKEYTDADRRRRIHSSDSNLRYTTMERAYGYLEMREEDNMTHEQIAEALHLSRQTVDNYIKLTELPREIQQKIDDGILTATDALKDYRDGKKQAKSGKLIVDNDTGETLGILTPAQEKHLAEQQATQDKIRGDEDEFKQEDNSVTFAGSKGGPKEEGSGAIVVGTDSIYMQQQKKALWKQFVNRYEKIKSDVIMSATLENGYLLKVDDILAERLANEYNLIVK